MAAYHPSSRPHILLSSLHRRRRRRRRRRRLAPLRHHLSSTRLFFSPRPRADISDSVPPFRLNVEALVPFWKRCEAVIFENDSHDGTRAALLRWADEAVGYSVRVIECEESPGCQLRHGSWRAGLRHQAWGIDQLVSKSKRVQMNT